MTTVRRDPIRARYYSSLEAAETSSNLLFYVAAALSFFVVMIDQSKTPGLFDTLQIVFVVCVAALLVVGMAVRLYWAPAALDARRQDLLSNAFGVSLTHERTAGYYNNGQRIPLRRLAASTMENCFFTRAIARTMAVSERIRSGVYLVIFLVVAMYRHTDLTIAATAAQMVFSEQIVSRWLRLEWLRMRSSRAYDGLYALLLSDKTDDATFCARSTDWFGYYESAKSGSGITLSDAIFERMNSSLSGEWEEIKAGLQL